MSKWNLIIKSACRWAIPDKVLSQINVLSQEGRTTHDTAAPFSDSWQKFTACNSKFCSSVILKTLCTGETVQTVVVSCTRFQCFGSFLSVEISKWNCFGARIEFAIVPFLIILCQCRCYSHCYSFETCQLLRT